MRCIAQRRTTYKVDVGSGREDWFYGVTGEIEGAGEVALVHIAGTAGGGDPVVVGKWLALHAEFPLTDDQIRDDQIRDEDEWRRESCPFMKDEGPCFGYVVACTYAAEFFTKHGRATFEQSESFWKALEEHWLKYVEKEAVPMARKSKCSACGGCGIVERKGDVP